jgi:hypothetical protein
VFVADLGVMKHRFLIHSLNHTTLLVDISKIRLPEEAFPPQGKLQPAPSLRFQTWSMPSNIYLDWEQRRDR